MMKRDFCHLHTHTQYSILDSTINVKDLISKVKEDGMSSCAITDHGNMHGVIEFYKAAKAEGIKPIIGCLLAGQEIVTEYGVKNIEDIVVGDLVLTHMGRFRPVTQTFKRQYKGNLHIVQLGQNAREIPITEEHPILVTERRKASKWHPEKFKKAIWLKPLEIKTGKSNSRNGILSWQSYASLPKLEEDETFSKLILKNILEKNGFIIEDKDRIKRLKDQNNKYDSDKYWNFPSELELDEDIGRFLGLYAAEGSLNHYPKTKKPTGQICFSFNIDEVDYSDFILKILKEKFCLKGKLYIRPNKSTREVVVYSIPLAYFLDNSCSSGARTKRVPTWMYKSSKKIRNAFTLGVLQGDSKKDNGTLKVSSRNLAWGMRILMADQGHWGSITEGYERNKYKFYSLNLATNRKYSKTIEQDDKILKPIAAISPKHVETTVYNIEVFEDNSYVSDITMHNCEAYITMDPDGLENEEKTRDNYHMVLLAMDKTGYKNLMSLITAANISNVYYKPRIYWENLLNKNEGIIITTGCLGGILAKETKIAIDGNITVLGGTYLEDKKRFVDKYNCLMPRLIQLKEVFGDRLYIELQDHDMWQQKAFNLWAQRTAMDMGIETVVTCDAHFLRAGDRNTHALLIAQQMKQTLDEYLKNKVMFYDNKCYIRTPDDMYETATRFGYPEAFDNTMVIANRCNLEIQLGVYENPSYEIEKTEDYDDFKRWKEQRELI